VTRTSARAANALLVVVSLSIAVVLCEVLGRLLLPQIAWHNYEDLHLGWSSREYQRFDPTGEPKPPGRKRILFVGDSFLAGAGVSSFEKRFPALLAARLAPDTEVRVLAASGWGTDQELLAFLQKGRSWQPDLVVVAFCANNDISNNLSNYERWVRRYKPYFVLGDGGQLVLFDPHGRPLPIAATLPAQQWPFRFRSHLLDLVRLLLLSSRSRHPASQTLAEVDPRYQLFMRKWDRVFEIDRKRAILSWSPQNGVNRLSAYIHEPFELNTYQWRLLEAILALFRDETTRAGAQLAVMLLPVPIRDRDLHSVAGGDFERRLETPDGPLTLRAAEPRDRLRQLCERLGIRFFDPTADFIDTVRRRDIIEEVWPTSDKHFSDVGHAVIADLTYDWVVREVPTVSGAPQAGQRISRPNPPSILDR
jgi:lysophospholipase L1-like esterase